MSVDKEYNLMVGLRIREVRESMHLTRERFSEKCDISTSFLADIAFRLRQSIRFVMPAIFPQTILSLDINQALTEIL